MEPGDWVESRAPDVFVFNPFSEGYLARGKAFTPVQHQVRLAEDLANLPQFLCEPRDVVLVPKRPSAGFLERLKQAGFAPPEFVELREGRIDPAGNLAQRKIGSLRPWAWAPDSVELFEPLFAHVSGEAARSPDQYFNEKIARLYSKAWSAGFLRKILAPCREPWLCSEHEAGVPVDTLKEALAAIGAIRGRGHHRVVIKESLGLAGHNAIRLWEPEMLATQRQWLANALSNGRQVVVEPWLERELDFSIQLEMGFHDLKLCGHTGLINDRKGQFLANWAEPDCIQSLPAGVAAVLGEQSEIPKQLQCLYREIFSRLKAELLGVGYIGPVSIDSFVYRAAQGGFRLKPVVEINPRYTMGRVTMELMKHVSPESYGMFRLISRAQARAQGFADLSDYARSLGERLPLRLEGEMEPRIRQGAVCLNEPAQARVCLATFEVSSALTAWAPGASCGSVSPAPPR